MLPVAVAIAALLAMADVPRAGRYGLWLGGSFRRTVVALVDGHAVGSVHQQLNNEGQETLLGEATLGRGPQRVALRYGGSRALLPAAADSRSGWARSYVYPAFGTAQ
jgi:hypothetical protein